MKKIPMRLLLKFHLTTRAALIAAELPEHVNLTAWVNLAIREKLERERDAAAKPKDDFWG